MQYITCVNNIVLMARDPHQLYAYWDISPQVEEKFTKDFGIESWENSVPFLKVTNITLNQSFYVKINDFAKHWFIPITDANCVYSAEIGRKLSDQLFIPLATAKPIDVPTNTVSTDNTAYFTDYRDLNRGHLRSGDIQVLNEIYKKTENQIEIGISSEQFNNAGINKYLGISSNSLMKG